MQLILVRHPPPAIAEGVCYGRLDPPLRADAAGTVRTIVAALAGRHLARIWTSPAQRCRILAEAAGAATGAPLRFEPRLLELDFGAWEGLKWDDVPRAALDAWAADPEGFAPPGGESGAALLHRVGAVHAALREAAEDCAVIAHGGPLKLLSALLRGEIPDLLARAPALGSIEVLRLE